MKHRAVLALIAAVAGAVLLVGCQPLGGGTWSASSDCKACHSGEPGSTFGPRVLANQAGYQNSGHFKGPRVLLSNALAASTGEIYEFEGSDAMYTNSCGAKCHSDQGFVQFVNTGSAGAQSAASPPGCFTCHKPHETGDFSLRTTNAVVLADGATTFDSGSGNLCVNCHQNTGTPAGTLKGYSTSTGKMAWTSRTGPHQGVQGDMMMAANFSREGANTYQVSKHLATGGGPQGSCVGCHKYEATANAYDSLEMGGHGFYLTGAVHGASKDVTALCKNCHPAIGTTFAPVGGEIAASDWDGSGGAAQDKLLEIKGLRNTLIGYFATLGLIVTPTNGVYTVGASNEWNKDWIFGSATVQVDGPQSQALWNLRIFIADRSNGIHNPTGAAQMLYDSIHMLNADGAALPLGINRPPL